VNSTFSILEELKQIQASFNDKAEKVMVSLNKDVLSAENKKLSQNFNNFKEIDKAIHDNELVMPHDLCRVIFNLDSAHFVFSGSDLEHGDGETAQCYCFLGQNNTVLMIILLKSFYSGVSEKATMRRLLDLLR